METHTRTPHGHCASLTLQHHVCVHECVGGVETQVLLRCDGCRFTPHLLSVSSRTACTHARTRTLTCMHTRLYARTWTHTRMRAHTGMHALEPNTHMQLHTYAPNAHTHSHPRFAGSSPIAVRSSTHQDKPLSCLFPPPSATASEWLLEVKDAPVCKKSPARLHAALRGCC